MVLVLVEGTTHPESAVAFRDLLTSVFPETREYDGCIDCELQVNQDDPNNMIIVEHWESREQYEDYLAWRVETGLVDQLGAMLVDPPNIRFFDAV